MACIKTDCRRPYQSQSRVMCRSASASGGSHPCSAFILARRDERRDARNCRLVSHFRTVGATLRTERTSKMFLESAIDQSLDRRCPFEFVLAAPRRSNINRSPATVPLATRRTSAQSHRRFAKPDSAASSFQASLDSSKMPATHRWQPEQNQMFWRL
jgi:hypothetical protein